MSEKTVSLQIAFEGGQSVGADVSEETAAKLAAALDAGETMFELDTEGDTFLLALGKIVYVRRAARETRIGFAASA